MSVIDTLAAPAAADTPSEGQTAIDTARVLGVVGGLIATTNPPMPASVQIRWSRSLGYTAWVSFTGGEQSVDRAVAWVQAWCDALGLGPARHFAHPYPDSGWIAGAAVDGTVAGIRFSIQAAPILAGPLPDGCPCTACTAQRADTAANAQDGQS